MYSIADDGRENKVQVGRAVQIWMLAGQGSIGMGGVSNEGR